MSDAARRVLLDPKASRAVETDKARALRHSCPYCDVVVRGEWPCLSAKDAKDCRIAKAAGVQPKRRLPRK